MTVAGDLGHPPNPLDPTFGDAEVPRGLTTSEYPRHVSRKRNDQVGHPAAGIIFTPTPRHADLLMVTRPVPTAMQPSLGAKPTRPCLTRAASSPWARLPARRRSLWPVLIDGPERRVGTAGRFPRPLALTVAGSLLETRLEGGVAPQGAAGADFVPAPRAEPPLSADGRTSRCPTGAVL